VRVNNTGKDGKELKFIVYSPLIKQELALKKPVVFMSLHAIQQQP
jgi:hypothetical protein